MGNGNKRIGLERSRTRRWLRGSYKFWRRAGLAPWCSLRFAAAHRLGLLNH